MSTGNKPSRSVRNGTTESTVAAQSLRLATYARMLRGYLESMLTVAGPAHDSSIDDFVRHLRIEYGVSPEEHLAVWQQLVHTPQGAADPLAKTLESIENAAQTINALQGEPNPTHAFLSDVLRQARARSIDVLVRSLRVATDLGTREIVRAGLLSDDPALRETAFATLRTATPPALAERVALANIGAAILAEPPSLTDWLRSQLDSSDAFVRALALYALYQRGAAGEATWSRFENDEHEIVRETARYVKERSAHEGALDRPVPLITLERIIALRSAPVFTSLSVQSLADLAYTAVERDYVPGAVLCAQGEQSTEVFILITGEVRVVHKTDDEERVIGAEAAGGFIGEMAALSPAPRMATVYAGPSGVRALCLNGEAFRETLGTDMTAAYGVIRTLTERYRRAVERGVRQQIQIQQLRVEIDEVKKTRQVAEITESDYFRRLQERARRLRGRPATPTE